MGNGWNVKPWGRGLLKGGVVGLTGLFLFSACHKKEGIPVSSDLQSPLSVNVMHPESSGATREVPVAGVVRGIHEADLTARVSGQVETIPVHLGQKVSAGQLLMVLSDQPYASHLTRARAAFSYARSNFDRLDRLFKDGSASRSEWDRAKQSLDVATAEERGAKAQLSWTRIVAPFPGRVANRAVRKGDVVLPGAPLLSVIDARRLQVVAHVADTLSGHLTIALHVRFEVEGRVYSGTIRDLSPRSDPTTHTVTVKVLLAKSPRKQGVPEDNRPMPTEGHLVGMYGKLLIPVSGTPGLFVPGNAVIDHEGLHEVFAVVQGHAQLRYVRTGRTVNGKVEILSGLSAGEAVVVTPPATLSDGMAVSEKTP